MMHEFRADLHCHSTFSDGTNSPEQLIQLAIDKGLSGLSITDHDTTLGYSQALEAAKKQTFPLLGGIELSASYHSEPVHILGYAYNLKSEDLLQLCGKHKLRREERNREIVEKLCKLGITLDLDELIGKGGTYGRPHIAYLMQKGGYVTTIKEAFDRYLGDGKLAYVPGKFISVEETIETIKRAQGFAVLAHPHLLRRSTTIRAVLNMPFDGLEGYYARFGPAQEAKWLSIAHQKGWIITGGSDYHGETKPTNLLGSSWVDKNTFDSLYAHFVTVNDFNS